MRVKSVSVSTNQSDQFQKDLEIVFDFSNSKIENKKSLYFNSFPQQFSNNKQKNQKQTT